MSAKEKEFEVVPLVKQQPPGGYSHHAEPPPEYKKVDPSGQPYGHHMPTQQPGVVIQQPGMAMPQSGMGMQQHGMVMQQPGMVMQQPGMVMHQSGMVMQQPGMVMQQPGVVVQQPGMVPQQPGMVVMQSGGLNPMGEATCDVWMLRPEAPPNCPPGLEYLTQLDALVVKQKIDLIELTTNIEMNNKFKIKNSSGQNVYSAVEDTDCCTRQCCGAAREFNMKINDYAGNEVIHLYRPYRCQCCCYPCCLQEIEVTSPPGTLIGYIVQNWTICTPCCAPQWDICDANRNPILKIKGPGCICVCCSDMDFKLVELDGISEVGKITRQWMGWVVEQATDADTFAITFPMDLDVRVKALMLGAVMLIDFMYFERPGNRRRRR